MRGLGFGTGFGTGFGMRGLGFGRRDKAVISPIDEVVAGQQGGNLSSISAGL